MCLRKPWIRLANLILFGIISLGSVLPNTIRFKSRGPAEDDVRNWAYFLHYCSQVGSLQNGSVRWRIDITLVLAPHAAEETGEFLVIWDAMRHIWHHSYELALDWTCAIQWTVDLEWGLLMIFFSPFREFSILWNICQNISIGFIFDRCHRRHLSNMNVILKTLPVFAHLRKLRKITEWRKLV